MSLSARSLRRRPGPAVDPGRRPAHAPVGRTARWATAAMIACGLLAGVRAAPAAQAAPADDAREIVASTMEAFGIPGMSAAVAVDGTVVWAEGFGLASLETGSDTRSSWRPSRAPPASRS